MRSPETILSSKYTQRISIASIRTLLEVLDVAAGERDADLVHLGGRDGRARGVVLFFTLGSDVTHFGDSGD